MRSALSFWCRIINGEMISSAAKEKGKGRGTNVCAVAASHHKDLSFVCLNKGNSNQKTDCYGLLPLSPGREINDGDKLCSHTPFLVAIVLVFIQSCGSRCSDKCDL